MTTASQVVMPPRWRTPPPHPVNPPHTLETGEHATVQVFYQGLPLVSLEAALLFVADNPGWRLRKVAGGWRAVQ